MEHRERYLQLLSIAHRDALLGAIRRQGYFEALKAQQAEVVDGGELPYLRFDVESNPGFTALSGGLLLDLEGVVPDAPPCRYYLPYVGLTPKAEPGDLEHELGHVNDLLERLRVEPTYSDDMERLGMVNVKEPRLLGESTAFEVRKIFLLEAPSFARDYDTGQRTLEVPLLPGFTVKYECASKDEFVGLWMASYLKNLETRYLERFPECSADIARGIEQATDRFGEPLFGRQAWTTLMALRDALPGRLAAQVTGGTRIRTILVRTGHGPLTERPRRGARRTSR